MKKIGVVRFPGSNCDRDVFQYVQDHQYQAEYLWHLDQFNIHDYEGIILPGGFSYGDYLRAGALSARSPVMKSVADFAQKGRPVLGICNGFQVLVETHILPGALVQNSGLKFIDGWVNLKFENQSTFWAQKESQKNIRLPIAHGEGRFYAPQAELEKIEDCGQVWLRYESNPNGSLNDIAGVLNRTKNVAGLMPHPERAYADWMGGIDGWSFL
ncbi:MAG: phosphoribosylformylglycinamidine synthase subunit PurQ [Oligoflexia bacterium]|nr:MAG: phosphoribosylformylglycinamidine synthase subunit PurQ [Oligoflexia bacterium]